MEETKKLSGRFWDALQLKGRVFTIVAIIIAFPVNILAAILLYVDPSLLDDGFIKALIVLNTIAMAWAMLPSEISVKGASFEFVVKD